jgi:hypothetical protein
MNVVCFPEVVLSKVIHFILHTRVRLLTKLKHLDPDLVGSETWIRTKRFCLNQFKIKQSNIF